MYCSLHVHLSQRWPTHSYESHNSAGFSILPGRQALSPGILVPLVTAVTTDYQAAALVGLDQPPLIYQFIYQYIAFLP